MSSSFLHLFTDNAALCLLLSISLVSPPLVLMQLQDRLTSMTSSERCSISRGCEHDQVGTSLSSFGHKGRVACDRTSPPTEKHQLLFAANGCYPFTSMHSPSSILALFLNLDSGFFPLAEAKFCAPAAFHLSAHVREVKGM